MVHNNREVLDYWNNPEVESMYDKHLLGLEIALIRARLTPNTKILDAGCGGGGTLAYAAVPGVTVRGIDFSETRLEKAAARLAGVPNVVLERVDQLDESLLGDGYDFVISQRCLINLMDWDLQRRVLLKLMASLRPGGHLLMLEGSQQGVAALNRFRELWGLPAIPIKWHNLFFDDAQLEAFMAESGYALRGQGLEK